MAGFRFAESQLGSHTMVFRAPLGASQTYDQGDPVQISSNQLVQCDQDAAEVLDSEFIGFAFESAVGGTAASRTALTVGSFESATGTGGLGGGPFADIGASENNERTFVIPTPDTIMVTENYFADATGAAQTTISGADLYDSRQICSAVGGQWGLCAVDAVVADDVSAQIVRITNARGEPFNADTGATTAGPGTGVTIYFRINNIHALNQISGG